MQISNNLLRGAPAYIAGVLFVMGVLILLLISYNPLEENIDYPEIPEYTPIEVIYAPRQITYTPIPGIDYFDYDEDDVDYFQDNLDYYYDDPEDEITYSPEVFEAWND